MTVSDHALARPAAAARVRGPLVWLDMDQKELDDAYDQSVYAPNMQQVRMRIHRNSELARERLGIPKRLAYGPMSIETLDLYATKAWARRSMSSCTAALGAPGSRRTMRPKRKCS